MSFPPWTPTDRHDTYPSIDPSLPTLSSKGKVILITGGGRGIGRSTALAFARSGAKAVIITSRSSSVLVSVAAEITALRSAARYFVADATDQVRMQEVFVATKKEFGSIDVVVNNAGYLPSHALIKDAPLLNWWAAFETNVKGGFIAIQAFLQHASPGATLISIISALAHTPYFLGFSSYSASKLAVVKLMQDVHAEYPQFRVFSVQPGLIDTETSSKSDVKGQDTVDLPAGFSLWLASPESDFLRGRTMWANWDVDELKAKREEILHGDLLKMVLSGWP